MMIAMGVTLWATGALSAQYPAEPPLPKQFQATLRYDITAQRDVHVAKYDAMIEHLQKLGFVFNPPLEKHDKTDREDPGRNRLQGTLPSENLLKLFDNPHIASTLVVPDGLDLPADAGTPVRVRLELPGGLPLPRQRELVEQTRAVLYDLGFREALGYDHRGYTREPFTRLVGMIPAGQLLTLTRDLRTYPFGWFAPRVGLEQTPTPLQLRHPILVAEVLPPTDLIRPYTEEKDAVPPEGLEKIGVGLWQGYADKIRAGEKDVLAAAAPIRVEIFLTGAAGPTRATPSAPLTKAVPSLFIEGQVGQILLAMIDPSHIAALARLPEVLLVRLPRLPVGPVATGIDLGNAEAEIVKDTGLAELHALGRKGKKIRIAVVDRDFRGWERMKAEGKLPASTRFVDLTAQYFAEVLPAEETLDPALVGYGTQCAAAAALAAPEAELVLVRILGQSPLELVEAAQFFGGDLSTNTLAALQDLLTYTEKQLANDRRELLAERTEILESFRDDTDDKREYGYLGPVFGWLFSDRSWHYERMAYQKNREADLRGRLERFRTLISDVASLRGVELALSARNWPTGYPLGGSSSVVRWFNEKNRGAVWVQAAGNSRGQAWNGPFRDDDGNGILEFAAPTTPLAKGRWTHELAFLKWEKWSKDAAIPNAAPIRVSLQWREPHDPEYHLNPTSDKKEERDPFATPQARLDVLLLRQVDPEGKTVGADVFELVARNAAAPVRLEDQAGTTVYETSFNAVVQLKSQYALRVISPAATYWALVDIEEGRPVYLSLRRENSRTTRPSWAPTLPNLEKRWELEPRIFVETLTPLGATGRIVFAEAATDAGTLGIPAEARGMVVVGAIDEKGRKELFSAEGPPAFAALGAGPTLYAPDRLQLAPKGQGITFGSTNSASLAAGWLAAAFTDAFQRERVLFWLNAARGKKIGGK